MNCHDFQLQMEHWLTGQTKSETWKSHMDTCSHCSHLYLEIMEPTLSPDGQLDEPLTNRILAVTSRKPCDEIVLKDDELLTPFEKKLQDYHVFNCTNCRNVIQISLALKKDLHLLAEHRVSAQLSLALYRIFKMNKYSLTNILKRIWIRPRFSLEFSYTLALFFWIGITLTPENVWSKTQNLPNGKESIEKFKTSSLIQWQDAIKGVKYAWSTQQEKYQQVLDKAEEKGLVIKNKTKNLTRELFQKKASKKESNQSKEIQNGQPNENSKQ